MKAVSLKENIASYYFLKTEANQIADEQEKIALDNDVTLFETPKDRENFIQGFINGACWQKGRGDAKCVDLLEFIREKEWMLHKKMNRWFMHGDENLTSKELFAEYDKNIKAF